MSDRTARIVGLLGGIASGKSTVARIFEAHGYRVLDADRAAHEVLEEEEVRLALRDRFGPGLVGEAGVDRKALAQQVFADPEARAWLEGLTHPRIRVRLLRGIEEAREQGCSVLLDVPLLLEGGLWERCDALVLVDTPDELRKERARTRGMEPEDWRCREAVQASIEEKHRRASHRLDNSGEPASLEAQVLDLLRQFASSSGASSGSRNPRGADLTDQG